MNTQNEKKWFVYIGDNHQGPFSILELYEKKKSGQIASDTHAWCEGMPDWLTITHIPELDRALSALEQENLPKVEEPAVKPTQPPALETPTPQSATIQAVTEKKKSSLIINATLGVLTIFAIAFISLVVLSRTSSFSVHAKIRPTLNSLNQALPFLRGLFQMVPNMGDLKPEELEELNQARLSASDAAVKISIALSNKDPNRPSFYVSTSLPHDPKIEVAIVGEGDTLLNRLQFYASHTVTLQEGFGLSEVFLTESGQPIPKGQYTVYAFEALEQEEPAKSVLAAIPQTRTNETYPSIVPPQAKFIVKKAYFLGGDRDETYLTRLRAFHDKIKQNAERESQELRQYQATLDQQFKNITALFQKLSTEKKITARMKANWKKETEMWIQISSQLDQSIQTWSKETLDNEFFYGKIYDLVKSSFASLKSLIQVEMDQMNKPSDPAAFSIQHGKLLSETREALDLLRTKLDAAANAPKSPSGLPTREGL